MRLHCLPCVGCWLLDGHAPSILRFIVWACSASLRRICQRTPMRGNLMRARNYNSGTRAPAIYN